MGHPTEEQALGLGTDDGGIEEPPVLTHLHTETPPAKILLRNSE